MERGVKSAGEINEPLDVAQHDGKFCSLSNGLPVRVFHHVLLSISLLEHCAYSRHSHRDALAKHFERENAPEFHEICRYHSNTKLSQGTVGDAGLSQDTELSVVVSLPEQNKLMEISICHSEDPCRNKQDTKHRIRQMTAFRRGCLVKRPWRTATSDARRS